MESATHEMAFLKGGINAVVTFEPIGSKLLASGGKVVFNSAQIPGEIVDVLVVNDDYLERYPNIIRTLIREWFRALSFLNKQAEAAANIMSMRMDLSVRDTLASFNDLVLPTYNKNFTMLMGMNAEQSARQSAYKLERVMKDRGLLSKKVVVLEMFKGIETCYQDK